MFMELYFFEVLLQTEQLALFEKTLARLELNLVVNIYLFKSSIIVCSCAFIYINKARLLNGLSLSCFNSKTAQDCSKSIKGIMRVKITI